MGYPRLTREDLAYLKQTIGESHVSAGESNLDLHSRDESYHEPHRPDVVVWPQKTADVVAAVKLAARKGYAITPWCAGTSLEGNPIPVKGGICLDFTEMNRIIEIREKDSGRGGGRPRELTTASPPRPLPADPGAHACIGGMIGNNAWGAPWLRATRDASSPWRRDG
jgi:D-lactate dehydrogenase (cytochrome)